MFFDDPQKQAKLRDELQSWMGTPFRHNAHVKGAGVDCVRLVGEVMVSCGVEPSYDFGYYSLDFSMHNERSILVDYIEKTGKFVMVEPCKAQLGDIAVFKIGKCPHHAAIMLDDRMFVHALMHNKVTHGDITDSTWAKRLVAFYRAK